MFVLKYLRTHNVYSCITPSISRHKRYASSVTRISTISDVYSLQKKGQVQIEGWIIGIRKMKSLLFLDVTDGSSCRKLQVTVDKCKAPSGLSYGASVAATGSLHTNKNNQLEVLVDDITVLGSCNLEEGFPFAQRSKYNSNHEREYLHLRPRTQSFSTLLRIRHKCELVLNNLLDEYGYFNIDVPVLTTNDCEGGGEVFIVKPDNENLIKEMKSEGKVDANKSDSDVFFNNKTYLSVSGQLHLEVAARSLRKVYSLGPIFRAENSKSRLHLSEFYMLETETAFINDITDIMVMFENMLKDMIKRVLDEYSEEIHSYLKLTEINLDEHFDSLNRIVREKFKVMTYDEAFDILNRNSSRFKSCPRNGETFAKEHELFLVDYNNKVPVFIVEWPAVTKPFYMKAFEKSSNKVLISERVRTITQDRIWDVQEGLMSGRRCVDHNNFLKRSWLSERNDIVHLLTYRTHDWIDIVKLWETQNEYGVPEYLVEAMDLLCTNVGELCGGGVREDNYDKLKSKIEETKFGTKLDWYLELRKYGNVTTGGFGMGFERFLQLLLATSNIKDTIPFPRWPHNCKL